MTDSNTLPVLEAGRDAYKRIQESGRMLRDDWRTVGVALLVGRAECLSPKTGKLNAKKFGAWCVDNGFGSIDGPTRSDALWLADEWDVIDRVLYRDGRADGLMHPKTIRQAFRKATKISEETAAKAMKLFRRSDDEASSDTEVAAALKALDRMAEVACMDRATFVDVCSEIEEKKEEEKAKTPKAANPEFRENLAAAMQEQLEALQRQVESLTSLLTKHGISVPVT